MRFIWVFGENGLSEIVFLHISQFIFNLIPRFI